MSLKHLTCPSKILAASISASATSFKLNNIKGWDDVNLTSSDFGSQAFAVIRNANNTILELIEFDPSTIASVSITILKRGLKFTGDLTTEVTANKLAWTKGDTYIDIGVDTPQMYQWLQEYIDAAVVAGGVPATTTVLGLAKMSVAPVSAASPVVVGDNDPRVPTVGENDAMAGGGDFGTPATGNKFITEDFIAARPIQIVTFTSSGTWTKDAGLKYIIVEGVGAGAGGNGYDTDGTGGPGVAGGGAGYFKKVISAAALGATETVTIGAGGAAGQSSTSPTSGTDGGNTTFGSHATANGGGRPTAGTATGGNINIPGEAGGTTFGGNSFMGYGGNAAGAAGTGYGAGGSGGEDSSGAYAGVGTSGIVIVTEYYS